MHINQREIFLKHIGQTSDSPFMLEIERAEGIYMYSTDQKKYIDLIAGVSVSCLGHCHPKVVKAVQEQVEKYMHLMVYGEYIEHPQTRYAKMLTDFLPSNLNCVYFVNSGSEANEAALKLSKRYTGRPKIISMVNAYHGSTSGAMSVLGNEYFKNSFRPLLPGIDFIRFNEFDDLSRIDRSVACVIVEPVQAEAGIILPENNYLQALKNRCTETGTLLIFDEVQTGFGRLGEWFAFMKYNVVPDILCIAKAMGGGMPIGALVSDKKILDVFQSDPVLGHITTFGGHPVSAAAACATLETLKSEKIIENVNSLGKAFTGRLRHKKIKQIRGAGLFLAVELENTDLNLQFIKKLRKQGVVTDWFIFHDQAFRIAPPLIITEKQIDEACEIIIKTLDEL